MSKLILYTTPTINKGKKLGYIFVLDNNPVIPVYWNIKV
jgi:hypothetical protein